MLFAISAAFISAAGAVMAPRWTYIDPDFAFNPLVSFQVVIMALLGGAGALYGPLLGVVPLVIITEVIAKNFSGNFPLVLGIVFIVIVYFLPGGVVGLVERWRAGAIRLPAVARRAGGVAAGPILEVSGLRKSFGGLVAVDGIDLTVAEGEILGLIGPNGSGKTTALNLISGALRPDEGEIRFRGAADHGACRPPDRPARHRAHLPDRAGAGKHELPRQRRRRACLPSRPAVGRGRPRARRRPARPRRASAARADVPAGQLTYIDQKRLELARALALDPELLLLDEWLAGLNPRELGVGIELVQSLRTEGLTIVMVEHVMDAIRSLCDRCVVMNAGRKIADGPPDAVLAEPEVVAAYIGDAVA